MQRRTLIIALGAVAVLALGAVAWNQLFTVPEPSGQITAIPVATQAEAQAEPVAEDGPTAEAEEVAEEDADLEAAGNQRTYTITKEESEVRFLIGELLFGEPKTVIGVSQEFAAQVLLDFDNPQNSQVGVVQINARTFVTDNDNRNGAINNRILNVGTFEFITFEPTSYVGLPESGAVGDSFEFQIIGDLTIRDITNQVTFDVSLNLVSEDRIEGFVSSVIEREAYNLIIPNVPSVTGVDEEVQLEMDFVALSD